VIALREALRSGANATQRYRTAYTLNLLPELHPGYPDARVTGWVGDRCGYFDAIEALDCYLPLA
jgi:hypothetical protein